MIDHILKHIKIQQRAISESSKALNLSPTSKEFRGDSYQVESERQLLLAVLRERLLKKELKSLTTSPKKFSKLKSSLEMTEFAEIAVNNINIVLRESLTKKPLRDEPVERFLTIVTQGTNVWGSSIVSRPVGSKLLEFPKIVTKIENLRPDFNMSVDVYSLNSMQEGVLHGKDKPQLNRTLNKSLAYLSQVKFFKGMKRTAVVDDVIRSPSFVKCGHLEIGLSDLKLKTSRTLTEVPEDSNLEGTIDLDLACKVHLTACHQGFLNYGEEIRGSLKWETRWCVLKGCSLMLWKHPRDQNKPPVTTIELLQHFSNGISEVGKDVCGMPRTIVMETVRVGDDDSLTQDYGVQR